MRWLVWLTVLALVSVAVAGGGAAVGIVQLFGTASAAATIVLVAAFLLAVMLVTWRSDRRLSTPYW